MLSPRQFDGNARPLVIEAIKASGLLAGLKVCLDAGDIRSLPAGSSKFLDASGNGYDWFLGTTGSATATDPTINGPAGLKSAKNYLSFDGGDCLLYDTTNEAWMDTLHKDNALLTAMFWLYRPDNTGYYPLLAFGGTGIDWSGQGFSCEINAANLRCVVVNGVAGGAISPSASIAPPVNKWTCVGFSINEAAGLGIFYCDGVQETFNATYSSPSASAASYTGCMMSLNAGTTHFPPSGFRLASMCVWQGYALNFGEMNKFYTNTRRRFDIG